MPSFMELPQEVRDQICGEVLLSPTAEAPDLGLSYKAMIEGRKSYNWPETSGRDSSRYCIRYLPSASTTVATCTPLLLVNHQLYAETMANLSATPQSSTYDLDLIVLDERLLCPTWLRVPVLTNNVDQVNVQLRVAGCHPKNVEEYRGIDIGTRSLFARGDGGPSLMVWCFYAVLVRFLRVGPTGECQSNRKHRSIVLKTLDIDVRTPPNIDPSHFVKPGSSRKRSASKDIGSVVDPDYLARFLTGYIEYLLNMDHHAAPYGKIFYILMNEIVLRRDGKVVERINIASRIPKLAYNNGRPYHPYEGSSEKNLNDFAEWKARAIEYRKQRGLQLP
ncbi:unnamed protein product [Periconia digitata]|uniref:F-box domain-containing protein n=1 Tax=Periconia digitata TaxID=1303443 RepID=A0A9W4XNL6_9PLEO|nr:unnamed protein product [Periconia digitata]